MTFFALSVLPAPLSPLMRMECSRHSFPTPHEAFESAGSRPRASASRCSSACTMERYAFAATL